MQVWRWISYISPFRYASDAVNHVVFAGATFTGYDECLEVQQSTCFGERGEDFLDGLIDNGNDIDVVLWVVILLIEGLAARGLVWLALKNVAM